MKNERDSDVLERTGDDVGARGRHALPSSSRYRVIRCIARGSMGAVYLGVQRGAAGFQRPVAIKRAHAHLLGTPERRQIILQEARNAAAVRHPNVVGIDDVEELDDELVLVMAYVDGTSLYDLVKSGGIPPSVALSIVRDACAGLHAIHAATDPSGKPLGLLHRDICPQNILVGLDGVARIIDFGIAKSARDPSRTSKNHRRGKRGYMAPEYLATGTSTASGDVFAMGVVLWEALTGRRLFSSASSGEVESDVVPLVAPADPRVQPAVDDVIRRAVARTPAERFASAADLLRALDDATLDRVASRNEVAREVARLETIRPTIPPPRLLAAPEVQSDSEPRLPARPADPPAPKSPTEDATRPVQDSAIFARTLFEETSDTSPARRHPVFRPPEEGLVVDGELTTDATPAARARMAATRFARRGWILALAIALVLVVAWLFARS